MEIPTDMETPADDATEPMGEPAQEPGEQPAEAYNLLPSLPPDEQKRIADMVYEEFQADWKSCSGWRETCATIMKLFLGVMPEKPEGFEECARVHWPTVAKAIYRLHARIYDQRFPAVGGILNAVPTGPEDTDRTDRVSKHMNWQLRSQMSDYVLAHDGGMLQWLLFGSAISYAHRDEVKGRPRVVFPQVADIVLPYRYKSDSLSFADVPRITMKLRLTKRELLERQDSGWYVNVSGPKSEDGMDPIYIDGKELSDGAATTAKPANDENPVRAVVDQVEGRQPGQLTSDSAGVRLILEQHRWLLLPNHDREKPVIVSMDAETKTLTCVALREDEDPKDRARFEREQAAREATMQAQAEQHSMAMAQHLDATMTPPPAPGEMGDMSGPQQPGGPPDATQGQPPPAMPTPPEPPPEPEPPKMIPIDFFTHYICEPNPEGILGIGIGFLLMGHNMAIDTIMSQVVDLGTLNNLPTSIHSRQAKLKKGKFELKLGQSNETDLMPEQLDKAFKFITFPPPNPAMGSLAKEIGQEAEELSGTGDILTGDVGGSRETATTTKIRSAMAMSNIAIIGRRYDKAQTEEARKIARINSKYPDEAGYLTVIGVPPGVPVPFTMAGDYAEDFDITFTADPRLASKPERVEDAKDVLGSIMSIPPGAINPAAQSQMITVALEGLYKAMDRPDMIAALHTPPPPPMMGPPGAGGPQPEGGPPKNGKGPPAGPPEGPPPGVSPTQGPPIPGPPPLEIGPS